VRQLDANAAAHVLDPVNTARCEQVLPAVLAGRARTVGGQEMCTNIYDVRLEDTAPACGMNWPVDLADIKPYLGRRDVVNALHAGAAPTAWTECRGRVHQELTDLRSPSAHLLLPRLLSQIEVLLFAGDQDFICNYMGVEATIAALEWNGARGLGTVATQTWAVNGSAAGTWVAARNLTYAKVFDASHMVGYDVPHVAHDMMLRFMRVDFAALAGGSARIPSAVGDAHKPSVLVAPEASATPTLPPSKTPEQDKAMWEAYYNAGSALLVFVVVLAGIAAVWWCRRRRARRGSVVLPRAAADRDEEESIPLRDAAYSDATGRQGKGKARAAQEEVMFEVGDSDEEK
jgi:carboxypeptidase D